jgi:NDP-sugar pyrophosphorylase family protein
LAAGGIDSVVSSGAARKGFLSPEYPEMSELRMVGIDTLGKGFIPSKYLPPGQDEHYLRNAQSSKPDGFWRKLKSEEIEALIKNANSADSWDNVLVTEAFIPHQVKNCEFYGLVRIGRLEEKCLEYHDLRVPVGLTNCRIIACDIGDDVAIHNVRYLAHYIIGDNVVLLNIDEMHTTDHAKFGNGIIKDGEDESVRVRIDLINETGARAVCPFEGMTTADAFLWAKYRHDTVLMKRLEEITQQSFDSRRGFYGSVGDRCVIKNCGILKDVKVGPAAYIKGADKLKNLTIDSSNEEPVQIGEGVVLVNGIIGRGCRVFYGCKAVRFIMGDNSQLKYGARLIHSYLGDNSTVSCCELLNNLIFPAHEQHHNNSFLAASLLMGQSNMAAGATIGSNHNSRANDGEVQAGRGFWPGLCVSTKHNCKFASFTLLAKGDYPAELNIPLPFALVSNNVSDDQLQVMPAYWWLYNMYALARNSWKFRTRDQRKRPLQKVEFDALAPDTAEEMFTARSLLEGWVGKAAMRQAGKSGKPNAQELRELGRQLLDGPADKVNALEVLGEEIENSSRKTVILKAHAGYRAYGQMLVHYAVKNLLAYMQANPRANRQSMADSLSGERNRQWVNLGGQLVTAGDLEQLKADIRDGKLARWQDIHHAYERLWQKYPFDKQRHAMATLLDLIGAKDLSLQAWQAALKEAVKVQQYISDQTFLTRKKDFDSPFRKMSFECPEEMTAVMGSPDSNSFVKQVRRETDEFMALVDAILRRG